MSNSWWVDEIDINKPTPTIDSMLNKLQTMEDIASFLQAHPRTITKYSNQLVDKIRSIERTGRVHLNALRTLINVYESYRYREYDQDTLSYGEAVYKVMSAYSEWLIPAYQYGEGFILYDRGGTYDRNSISTTTVMRRFEKSYLPAMLLSVNPTIADAFIAKYPNAKDDLYNYVIDEYYVDRKEECRNMIRDFLFAHFPTISSFLSGSTDHFEILKLKKSLIDQMDISNPEKIELQKLPIEDIIGTFRRQFMPSSVNSDSLYGIFGYAEEYLKHLERLDQISMFEKYYGSDAGLLFNEAISIFYRWAWEKTIFGDWLKRAVIEERKFIDYISTEYEVDPAIGKHFIVTALEWVNSKDVSPDELLRVQTLIKSDEPVVIDPNSEPVEPTFYEWKKDQSDFEEMAAYENDDLVYEEEATEAASRRKSNIRRTARMEKAKSKIYGVGKNVSDNVEKFDSQITGLFSSLKKLFVGDVRTEIIEGKHMTFMTVFKKLIGLAMLSQFGIVKGACALLVRWVIKRKMTGREKSQIIHELDTEIAIINEKINDASGDGNRKAKYAMMRTRAELERAKHRIRAGLGNVPKKSAIVKSSLDEGGY